MLLDTLSGIVNKVRAAIQPRNLKLVFAVFLTLFLVTELSLPYLVGRYYQQRSRDYVFPDRLPRNFEQIHRDFPSVLSYVEKHRGDYDYNVFFLGDSVAYGAGVGDRESIPAYLEQELQKRLPGKKVRVWNLAIPGSEPGDFYCLLRRVEHLEPDAIVADFNMLFYGKASIADPIAFNWLYLDRGLPADATEVIDNIYSRPTRDRITEFFDRNFRLYHYREWLNAVLFGGHPRTRLEEMAKGILYGKTPAPATASRTATNQVLTVEEKRKQRERVAFMYSPDPIDINNNEAYLFTKAILEHLQGRDKAALVFLTDQNRDILGSLITNPSFQHNVATVDRLIRSYRVPYLNFYGRMPVNTFRDNVHLTPVGNRIVAEELAAQLAPQLGGERP